MGDFYLSHARKIFIEMFFFFKSFLLRNLFGLSTYMMLPLPEFIHDNTIWYTTYEYLAKMGLIYALSVQTNIELN